MKFFHRAAGATQALRLMFGLLLLQGCGGPKILRCEDADDDGFLAVGSDTGCHSGDGGGQDDCDDHNDTIGGTTTLYEDRDGDGYGNEHPTMDRCPDGSSDYVAQSGDCDDENAAHHPDADEVCDEVDNDCNEKVDDNDEGLIGAPTWYADRDGDGYGDAGNTAEGCMQPEGYVSDNTDCDDDDPNCTQPTWYADADGDGYGTQDTSYWLEACDQPAGYVANSLDCSDLDADVHLFEICGDDKDNDCNGDAADAACEVDKVFIKWAEHWDGDDEAIRSNVNGDAMVDHRWLDTSRVATGDYAFSTFYGQIYIKNLTDLVYRDWDAYWQDLYAGGIYSPTNRAEGQDALDTWAAEAVALEVQFGYGSLYDLPCDPDEVDTGTETDCSWRWKDAARNWDADTTNAGGDAIYADEPPMRWEYEITVSLEDGPDTVDIKLENGCYATAFRVHMLGGTWTYGDSPDTVADADASYDRSAIFGISAGGGCVDECWIQSVSGDYIYGQVYEEGLTEGDDGSDRIASQICSSSTDEGHPADWPDSACGTATFNAACVAEPGDGQSDCDNRDEYSAPYSASSNQVYRFSLDGKEEEDQTKTWVYCGTAGTKLTPELSHYSPEW